MSNVNLITQAGAGVRTGGATTPSQPQQNANRTLREEMQNLREQIRQSVTEEMKAAQAKAATPQAPTPPTAPRSITIRGPDGTQTVVGVPPIPYDPNNGIPPEAVDISLAFFLTVAAIIIGLPIARAFARRMDRRSSAHQIPNDVSTQLAQLSQAVDAIALEVERISEGQRFTTRLLSEQRDNRQALPSTAGR